MRVMYTAFCMTIWLFHAETARCEEAVPVALCDLSANPDAYDHRLLRVSGRVLFGFENFSFYTKECSKEHSNIWLAYGGTLKSGAIPNGRTRRSEQPLTVEGVVTQLLEDSQLRLFDKLLHRRIIDGTENTLKVTVVGRYFAGKPGAAGVAAWRGFGMEGMYSLFAIQQVISAESGR